MNILMLTAVMYPVGTWYRTFNLAAALQRRGHSVSIVKGSMNRLVPSRESDHGVTIWHLPRLWGANLFHFGTRMPQDLAARIGMLALHRYDVVHAFTHHLNCLAPALAGRLLRPSALVVGDRDDLWTEGGLSGVEAGRPLLERLDHRFLAWTEREMGRWLGTMTVVSEDLLQRVVSSGCDAGRVRKIFNGCPTDRIRPGDRAAARKALGLPADRSILVFVGVGQYDIDLILDALVIFGRENPGTAAPLTVLIGPHEDRLRQMAQERGLANDVIATGSLTEAQFVPYLHAADVGLLPFADKPLNRARFPIKIGDYLAAGLPVLTNEVGEMGPLVREAGAGLSTAPDAASYASGLARLLSDRDELDACRLRARAAAERLTWDRLGEDLERFYLEMGAVDRRYIAR